jgi:nicotinate-nucleotide pyrophosphorylase (carboxylating)
MAFPPTPFGMSIHEILSKALAEDTGDGDHTSLSTIPAAHTSRGLVRAKQEGIVAGIAIANKVCEIVDPTLRVESNVDDGATVRPGDLLMSISGNTRSLLCAERLLLNCLQRMSGIATFTHSFVTAITGTNCRILDTRKTTPNIRVLEKWAVQLGGGANHRFGLFDMILIKDNHVDAAGGIGPAIQRANDYLFTTGKKLAIEIETRNINEVKEAIAAGTIQRIMLDNFSPEQLSEAVKLIDGRFETEASGGITLSTVRRFAETGVDFISVGALTHSFSSLDISMKIQPA